MDNTLELVNDLFSSILSEIKHLKKRVQELEGERSGPSTKQEYSIGDMVVSKRRRDGSRPMEIVAFHNGTYDIKRHTGKIIRVTQKTLNKNYSTFIPLNKTKEVADDCEVIKGQSYRNKYKNRKKKTVVYTDRKRQRAVCVDEFGRHSEMSFGTLLGSHYERV